MKTSSLLALIIHLAAVAHAAPRENILEDDTTTSFSASITCRESYKERLLVVDPGSGIPAFREVVADPRGTSAKIVANLAGFDQSEITSSMPVAVTLGGFAFAGTLAGSVEATKSGGTFPATAKRASFDLFALGMEPGKLVFSWSATRLIVTLSCDDLEAAGLQGIGGTEYVATYTDVSLAKDRPGSRSLVRGMTSCTLDFGTASGSRSVYLSRNIKRTYKSFSSWEGLEQFMIQSESMTGRSFRRTPRNFQPLVPPTAPPPPMPGGALPLEPPRVLVPSVASVQSVVPVLPRAVQVP